MKYNILKEAAEKCKRLKPITNNPKDPHWYGPGQLFSAFYDRSQCKFVSEASPDVILELIRENERLREALEYYANDENLPGEFEGDGIVAREALKGR